MAKWGNCDFSELEELQKKFEKLAKTDIVKFCQDVARELAARLLAKRKPAINNIETKLFFFGINNSCAKIKYV